VRVKFVLDTNTVSSLMRRHERARARLFATHPSEVGIPQPVIAEIAYGIARLPRSRRREALREQLDLLCEAVPRLDWTDEVSGRFGSVKARLESAGTRLEDFDLAIAAHALTLDATLVTSNVDHMKRVGGLAIENWCSEPSGPRK
jgi:tRNA(fMet)-specific endonuclease VapC